MLDESPWPKNEKLKIKLKIEIASSIKQNDRREGKSRGGHERMGEDILPPEVQIPRDAKRFVGMKRFRQVVAKKFFGQALDRMVFWRPPGGIFPLEVENFWY
jgi:hypothetical protein